MLSVLEDTFLLNATPAKRGHNDADAHFSPTAYHNLYICTTSRTCSCGTVLLYSGLRSYGCLAGLQTHTLTSPRFILATAFSTPFKECT